MQAIRCRFESFRHFV